MTSFVKEEDGTVTANVRTDVPTTNTGSICGRVALANTIGIDTLASGSVESTTNTTEEV